MSKAGTASMPSRRGHRWLIGALVFIGAAIFIGANAHLIYVAFASRPDCVPHFKETGRASGAFRAAESAC